MSDDEQQPSIIGHRSFAQARWRRSTGKLARQLRLLSASTWELQEGIAHIHWFLEDQHRHFQDLIARNDGVEDFCARCQNIMDGDDPEAMARERDWLIAGYCRRNAHRRTWLERLGLNGRVKPL